MKEKVTVFLICWISVGVVCGLLDTLESFSKDKSGCSYTSIASLTNPGFIFTCEMIRQRFEVGK